MITIAHMPQATRCIACAAEESYNAAKGSNATMGDAVASGMAIVIYGASVGRDLGGAIRLACKRHEMIMICTICETATANGTDAHEIMSKLGFEVEREAESVKH
jgi:hypothetical protein